MIKLLAVAALATSTSIATEQTGPEIDLPSYSARSTGVSGTLKSIGSDTMINLMTSWSEKFREFYPAVQAQVEGKGSSTAPPALIENQAQFGPMSRAMEREEIDAFREKFGYDPSELRVAIDCIAVFVNKDCPLDEITLDQIVDVFSVGGPATTWADLGVTDSAWAQRPISVYGRNSASGTYKFFKKAALNSNDYKPTVKETPGSAGVINAIAMDSYAIGYSGVGFSTPDVKALEVAEFDGEPAFGPTAEYANTGEYPIARFLYLYVNFDPRAELDPMREEFIRMLYSREGQEEVLKDGAYPVSAAIAEEEFAKLGLETTP